MQGGASPLLTNSWIDQYNHYMKHGRMRGGEKGEGPFERSFNPFYNNSKGPDDNNSSGGSGISSLVDSSNSADSNFIRNLLSPVDHSIPLDTLINQHFIIILALFFMVLALIIITLYFYLDRRARSARESNAGGPAAPRDLDLIIIFNKDYLLNNVKNKYILMYVKYVLFRTRVDIMFVSILSLSMLIFFAYCLHYLITHPIILAPRRQSRRGVLPRRGPSPRRGKAPRGEAPRGIRKKPEVSSLSPRGA